MKKWKTWIVFVIFLSLICLYTTDHRVEQAMPQKHQNMLIEETTMPVLDECSTFEAIQEAQTIRLAYFLDTPEKNDFVQVQDYIPEIFVDLKYSTPDNFTGQILYSFSSAWLRYGTVQKLLEVCRELEAMGLYLKIWDGFRPISAQYRLWEVCSDPTFVANPLEGFSSHSRGNTVDVTLVDVQGEELEMPTKFDEFSSLANRDYSDCSPETAQNAILLETIMEKHGFQGYWGEWWHFSDIETYEVEDVFDPSTISAGYPDCEEFITLRESPSIQADPLDKIPFNEEFTILGYTGEFTMVQYNGQRGYVLSAYTKTNP